MSHMNLRGLLRKELPLVNKLVPELIGSSPIGVNLEKTFGSPFTAYYEMRSRTGGSFWTPVRIQSERRSVPEQWVAPWKSIAKLPDFMSLEKPLRFAGYIETMAYLAAIGPVDEDLCGLLPFEHTQTKDLYVSCWCRIAAEKHTLHFIRTDTERREYKTVLEHARMLIVVPRDHQC